jgi:hypothetical protein
MLLQIVGRATTLIRQRCRALVGGNVKGSKQEGLNRAQFIQNMFITMNSPAVSGPANPSGRAPPRLGCATIANWDGHGIGSGTRQGIGHQHWTHARPQQVAALPVPWASELLSH